MPALRTDANLYRQYVYETGEPLSMPIHAYGGASDPNIQREHLERWREQTTGYFSLQQFEGGHFYLQSAQGEFLQELRERLG
jgi:surfactin synthase thioesterase subunit